MTLIPAPAFSTAPRQLFFTGGGAPPPPRTHADTSPRIHSPRRGVAAGAAVLIAIATIACGGASNQPPARGGTAKLRFAVMPKTLDLPVFNYAKTGAEREAAKRGNIEIIWRAPESADQIRQKEILESFITQKVDGIAI